MRPKASILIAEDEAQAREALRALLEDEGYRVLCASDGSEASHHLAQSAVEAALLDIRMPGRDGLELLRELKVHPAPPAVLIMTAYGTSAAAIEAMALGAFDYLTKPLNFDELLIQLERAIDNRRKTRELEAYRSEEDAGPGHEIVGRSPAMQKLYKLIGQVSATDSTVLIRGESGTGKEMVARAIHRHSLRGPRRLVKVNCASIPETLLEAEMFGHERGAFTGATGVHAGCFERAHRGTLLLDEIAEMPLALQPKLLRVLEDQKVRRVGGGREFAVDVRVLAATNREPREAVESGKLREDLFYRLNVFTITLPPLRERREDIPLLAQAFIARFNEKHNARVESCKGETMELLAAYAWPGNVRELKNVMERAVILARGPWIEPSHLPPYMLGPAGGKPGLVLRPGATAAEAEKELILGTLRQTGNNKAEAARRLGLDVKTIRNKLKSYGMN